MSEGSFPLIEELTIARFVGPLSLSRGMAYARAGRVTELEWDPAHQRVQALVQGNESTPYRCVVTLDLHSPRTGITASTCSCPVGFTCKHAAAVLVAANKLFSRPTEPVEEVPVDAGWRGALASLTGRSTEPAKVEVIADPERRVIALQFEPRHRVQRRADRWHEPRDETAHDLDNVDRLAVRPVTQGARGGWIKAALTWQNIAFQGTAGGFDVEQARWFGQFQLLKGSQGAAFTNLGSDWISLDSFDSSLLWALLGDASRLGIPLVGSGIASSVLVAGSASIGLDAELSDADGLTLEPTVTIDGVAHAAASARLIGGHGVYHLDPETGAVVIAPLTSPATREQRAVIERPRSVTVPRAEVEEFLGEHYPLLARSLPISSADESFTPPPVAPAELVLAARFSPKNLLQLAWHWEIPGGGRLPVDAPDAAFRDAAAERMPAILAAEILVADVAGSPVLRPPAATNGGVGVPEIAPTATLRGIDAAEFTARLLPELEAIANLRVETEGTRPDYRELSDAPVLTVSTVETESNDWFDLGVIITVEGKKVPFGPLFKALSKGSNKLLLIDNSYLSLKHPVFEPLRDLIEEAGTLPEWENDNVRISRYQTDLWAEFEDLADESDSALAWRRTVSGLRDLGAVEPIDPPAEMSVTLRPYQLEGFRWLAFLHANRLGGILADDMGLGKTAQTLALIAHTRRAAPTLAEPVVGAVAEPVEAPTDVSHPSTSSGHDASVAEPVVGAVAEPVEAPTDVSHPSTSSGHDASVAEPVEAPTDVSHPSTSSGHDASLAEPVEAPGVGAVAEPVEAPFLVVAPTSVVSNWAHEAARFAPHLRVVVLDATQGKRGRGIAEAAAKADIVLTTYAIMRIDADAFAEISWGGLVLDEAQFAKNSSSKVHQAALGIQAPFRLAVTGTPMENNLMELHALFQIVAPGLFPSPRLFAEKYRRPIELDHNVERLAKLRRRIRPLMLRRTKEVVAPELPPKQEQVLDVQLDDRHRRIYDSYLQRERQKVLGLVDDLDRNRFIVFRSLTLLRMLSLDASLIDPEQYKGVPSAKLDALLEQLDDVVSEGHQALVFSQFTSFLGKAAERLEAAGVPIAYLDGSTRDRGAAIKRFRDGGARVFLISLKAGGFGLNLTEADYVFMLDPWWNPASEAQAIDRAHRIGQDKQVMVYRMVASGTIEEKVMALKARKADLVSSIMDDDALFSEALSADDIRGLLEE